jgi:hypothetical protein
VLTIVWVVDVASSTTSPATSSRTDSLGHMHNAVQQARHEASNLSDPSAPPAAQEIFDTK